MAMPGKKLSPRAGKTWSGGGMRKQGRAVCELARTVGAEGAGLREVVVLHGAEAAGYRPAGRAVAGALRAGLLPAEAAHRRLGEPRADRARGHGHRDLDRCRSA